jgi:hypothetical protein
MGTLRDGLFLFGQLCPFCLLDPKEAAERLRQRAERILNHAKKASERLTGPDLLKALQMAQARAHKWVELASHVEKLDSWPRKTAG